MTLSTLKVCSINKKTKPLLVTNGVPFIYTIRTYFVDKSS